MCECEFMDCKDGDEITRGVVSVGTLSFFVDGGGTCAMDKYINTSK